MLRNIHVGNRNFKNLADAKQYCIENDFDPMVMIQFEEDFVIMTAEQKSKITDIVNYINSIIKIKHNNYMTEYGIDFEKHGSIDLMYFEKYYKNDEYMQNWKNKSYNELIELKECYKNICDIPL